jgi:RimJ/RimL family protein N-acetyltransferase
MNGMSDRSGGRFPEPPEVVTADELVLRAMTPEDWELEQVLSQDADVARWTFYPEAMDQAAAIERVRFSVEHAHETGFKRFVIWHNDTPVGTCGLAHLDTPTPEIMYVLLSAARGHGWATMAATALARWTQEAGYGAVQLETVEGNIPSERVAKRAGFTLVRSELADHRGSQALIHLWQRDHTILRQRPPSPRSR